MPLHRTRIIFTGRVQGVGFRATACHLALSSNLTGWVRNESDGSVLLEVQGDFHNVEAFLANLRDAMKGRIKTESSLPTIPIDDDPPFRTT
ncbi:acylphosphatase [soil metagenome]